MPAEPGVVALVSARNEGDVIGQVLEDLIAQGVCAYLLDDGSTDDTVAEAERFLGRGLLRIERLPASEGDLFDWERILRRKEALASELPGDWFLHHDADELRESPWPGRTLAESIGAVDRLGYNAIDFEVLNFWPTSDGFRRGSDLREAFAFYEPALPCDKVQVRCWKKQPAPADLVATGGHEAFFPGRRVFPLRFLLRHYPFRTQAQAERKVFGERRGRFRDRERELGWHHQYDGLGPAFRFVRDPAGLIRYDPEAVRLQLVLNHRGVEELQQTPAARDRALLECERLRELISRDLDARNHEVERLKARIAELGEQLDALVSSRTWRWSAPLRRALGYVRGR